MPRVLIPCSNCERPIYAGRAFEQWFIFDRVAVQGVATKCTTCGEFTT